MLLNCGIGGNSFRVPWTARRSNHSILKEITPTCLLEGLMLKLKLQYFGHLMQRTDSLEKILMLGKTEGGRRRGRQRMRWLDASQTQWTRVWASSGCWWWTVRPGVLQSVGSQRVGHEWAKNNNYKICIFSGYLAFLLNCFPSPIYNPGDYNKLVLYITFSLLLS